MVVDNEESTSDQYEVKQNKHIIKSSPKTKTTTTTTRTIDRLARRRYLALKSRAIKKHIKRKKCRRKTNETKNLDYIRNVENPSEDTYFALSLVGSLQRLKPMQRAIAKLNILKYLTECQYADPNKAKLPTMQ